MSDFVEKLAEAYVVSLQQRIRDLEAGTNARPVAVPVAQPADNEAPTAEVLAIELDRERAESARLRLVVGENAATIRRQHAELAAMATRAAAGVNARQHLRRAGDELARRLHAVASDDRDNVTALQAWADAKAGAVDDQPEPDPAA